MVSAADKHEVEDDGNWKTFLFDPENKTILGRNASSWFNLSIFYIGYYSLIAVISYYSITLYQSNMVVFPNEKGAAPRTNTRVGSPGVGTFPGVNTMNIDANRVSSFGYIDSINKKLIKEVEADDESVAELRNLGECSPLCAEGVATEDCKFPPLRKSYAEGNPCIYYQINKVMLWKPYAFNNLNNEHIQPRISEEESMLSAAVGSDFVQDQVYFYCYDLDLFKGYTNETDRVSMTYYSSDDSSSSNSNGKSYGHFNFDHWPIPQGQEIKSMKNPYVAVKFTVNPNYHGSLVNVACQAYAANLGPNSDINEAYAETALTVQAAGESTIAEINEKFN